MQIRKREWKIKNMQAECDKIQAKDKGAEGLTPGQASALARNEQARQPLSSFCPGRLHVLGQGLPP